MLLFLFVAPQISSQKNYSQVDKILKKHLPPLLPPSKLGLYLLEFGIGSVCRPTVQRRYITFANRPTVQRRYITFANRPTVQRRYITFANRPTVQRRYITFANEIKNVKTIRSQLKYAYFVRVRS